MHGYVGSRPIIEGPMGSGKSIMAHFVARQLQYSGIPSAGDWGDCNLQVLGFLSIPPIPEQRVSQSEAIELIGVYKDRKSDKEFTVHHEDGELTINLFLNVRTRLVR